MNPLYIALIGMAFSVAQALEDGTLTHDELAGVAHQNGDIARKLLPDQSEARIMEITEWINTGLDGFMAGLKGQ